MWTNCVYRKSALFISAIVRNIEHESSHFRRECVFKCVSLHVFVIVQRWMSDVYKIVLSGKFQGTDKYKKTKKTKKQNKTKKGRVSDWFMLITSLLD